MCLSYSSASDSKGVRFDSPVHNLYSGDFSHAHLNWESNFNKPDFICLISDDISRFFLLSVALPPPHCPAQGTLHYPQLFSGLSPQLAVKPPGRTQLFLSPALHPRGLSTGWRPLSKQAHCVWWEIIGGSGNLWSASVTHSFTRSSNCYFFCLRSFFHYWGNIG